jgi:opacity protein-like surface antigen
MKKLLLFLLTIFVVLPSFSQFKAGLKAGLSTTTLTMEDIKTINSTTASYTVEKLKGANFGFHGGLFLRLSVSKLFIQPEVLFSSTSNEYTITDLATPTLNETIKQTFNKLSIPVMAGLKFGPLRLDVGPAASLLIGSPKELIDDPDLKALYSKMSFGYQAGLGLDIINKLTLDVRYEGSLQKYQNKIENALGTAVNLDDRPNAFLFSVGLMF